ncbi:type III pantothenate kinase [Mucilaginibacter polytrichastri]|uniref:Type III pantothenate kinase n=1 Tax=Mucilaginibacter polytrichastri TaxID=1302689 RepID=A0A1Q6A673_9SPHI|nr:type III pantothenate kinase [Mucilaginibacter polytrichastri]OKS89504.1 Type III pantothenate kinase [Mucilaginibacter polytrichastri]SFS71331.1 type III pantothenate kinase [Mucilaginibacter polytrichastri]
MPNLVIDIGNTQTKLAVFNDQEMVWFDRQEVADASTINHIIASYQIDKVIASSVKKDHDWQQQISKATKLYLFNYQMAKSVHNHYRTPQTLGLDRLAAVAGAAAIYPGKASLVIDAGTCITYDYVDAGTNYAGGSISPGLSMRYKAMHNYTAGLPLVNKDETFNGSFGNDTISAMVSGVQNGIKYEVEGFVKSYQKQQPHLNIILTGGDGIFLDTLLKNSIFAPYIKIEPYLVLRGLNAVIKEHND